MKCHPGFGFRPEQPKHSRFQSVICAKWVVTIEIRDGMNMGRSKRAGRKLVQYNPSERPPSPQHLPPIAVNSICRRAPFLGAIAVVFLFFSASRLTADESAAPGEPSRPNVLMIAIDDLNDWVEPLGGHPQVQTPAMARLAARGVTFTNAHCQAPLCNPSRTSIMTARRPTSTGIYGLQPWIRNVDELSQLVTMPQYFSANGYKSLVGGKIHHGGNGRRNQPNLEADVWGPPAKVGVRPKQKLIGSTPGGNNPLMRITSVESGEVS